MRECCKCRPSAPRTTRHFDTSPRRRALARDIAGANARVATKKTHAQQHAGVKGPGSKPSSKPMPRRHGDSIAREHALRESTDRRTGVGGGAL